MKKLTLALSVLSLSIASSFAQADTMSQEQKVSGFYVGGTVGSAQMYTIVDTEYTDDNKNADSSRSSSSDTSFQVFGGYQFNRIVGVELAYTDFGTLTDTQKFLGSTHKINFSPTGLTLQANVGYTFHSGWRPFVLAGLTSLDLDQQYDYYDDDSTIAFRSGVGVEYAPAALKGLAFRATWTADWYATEYTETSFVRTNTYNDLNFLGNASIGASYKF